MLNTALAALSWGDRNDIRASVAFAGVIVSSICLGNLLSTNLWIGMVDQLMKIGSSQSELIERLLKDRNEPRS